MKKLFYTLCFIAVPVIIGILLYQRMLNQKDRPTLQNAQTIIPAAPQLQEEKENASEYLNENTQSFITLLSDEVLVEDIPADLNGDGKDDKIIAAKKLSDQFIYLLLFLQDPETQTFVRAEEEIKTEAAHAKTLSVYTLAVKECAHPLIVYSGMNGDAQQVFGIYELNIMQNNAVHSQPLVSIQADGQIILKSRNDISIAGCNIFAYYSDSDAPNTLNQIEKQYAWNEKKHHFEQTKELKIPGKKIESQFLKKYQTGNVAAFQEFLEGLWYQPSAKSNQNRSIYFNHTEKELIFSVNNIQEIFTVDSISPRRFGVYISTKNAAISSIHRRIDIELTGVDEVNIRVIDDIARLKIGVSSNWDGAYRKLNNTVREAQKETVIENTKKRLTADEKIWTSAEGAVLHFSDTAYQLSQDGTEESGWYTILRIKDKTVLQLKTKDHKERFFTLAFDSGKRLALTEVAVTLDGVTFLGALPLVFE